MSHVEYDVCDICGRRLFEFGDSGYLMRGAEGTRILKRIFCQQDDRDDVDVCDRCWDRIKIEARREANNG